MMIDLLSINLMKGSSLRASADHWKDGGENRVRYIHNRLKINGAACQTMATSLGIWPGTMVRDHAITSFPTTRSEIWPLAVPCVWEKEMPP